MEMRSAAIALLSLFSIARAQLFGNLFGGGGSADTPICPEISVTNGNVVYDMLKGAKTRGSQAALSCNFGYLPAQLSGLSVTCLSEGIWSGNLTGCVPLLGDGSGGLSLTSCPPADAPAYGTLLYLGNVAQLVCNIGYAPNSSVGDSALYCQPNGNWLGSLSECIPALDSLNLPSNPLLSLLQPGSSSSSGGLCGDLAAPAGATVLYDPLRPKQVGTLAFVMCPLGQVSAGGFAAPITCSASGDWSRPAPQCQALLGGSSGSSNPLASLTGNSNPFASLGNLFGGSSSGGKSGSSSSSSNPFASLGNLLNGAAGKGANSTLGCPALPAVANASINYVSMTGGSATNPPYAIGTVATLQCDGPSVPGGSLVAACQGSTWIPSTLGPCFGTESLTNQFQNLTSSISDGIRNASQNAFNATIGNFAGGNGVQQAALCSPYNANSNVVTAYRPGNITLAPGTALSLACAIGYVADNSSLPATLAVCDYEGQWLPSPNLKCVADPSLSASAAVNSISTTNDVQSMQ